MLPTRGALLFAALTKPEGTRGYGHSHATAVVDTQHGVTSHDHTCCVGHVLQVGAAVIPIVQRRRGERSTKELAASWFQPVQDPFRLSNCSSLTGVFRGPCTVCVLVFSFRARQTCALFSESVLYISRVQNDFCYLGLCCFFSGHSFLIFYLLLLQFLDTCASAHNNC